MIVRTNFSRGLNSWTCPHIVDDEECIEVENFQFSKGTPEARKGQTLKVDTGDKIFELYEFIDVSGTDRLCCINKNADNWAFRDITTGNNLIASFPPTSGPIGSAVMEGKLYIFRRDGMYKYDGDSLVQETGCSAPQSALTAVETNLSSAMQGTYAYLVTFVNDQQLESNPSPLSNLVTVSGKGIRLENIPTGPGDVIARNIYRGGGTLTNYLLAHVISDNSTTVISSDVKPDSELGKVIEWDHETPPPATFGAVHHNRLFVVNLSGQMKWSRPLEPWYWDSFNTAVIGAYDGEEPTGIIELKGRLYIFKPHSIWLWDDTRQVPLQICKGIGCIAYKSIAFTQDYSAVFFLGEKGIYYFDGSEPVLISQKIQNLLEETPFEYRKEAVGIFYDFTYILASPTLGKALAYDLRTKTWTLFSNVPFSNAVLWNRGKDLMVSVSNEVRYALTGMYDISSPISCRIRTKWLGQAAPEIYGRRLFISLKNYSLENPYVLVTPIVDGSAATTISNAINASLPVTRIEIPEEVQGNYISYDIQFPGSVRMMDLAMQFGLQREGWQE